MGWGWMGGESRGGEGTRGEGSVVESKKSLKYTLPSTFWRRVFPVNHLHNLTRTTKRQNTQITQINTTQKCAVFNSTTDTLKTSMLRERGVTEPGLAAFYDIQPGNGAGLFPGASRGDD